jgi:hypothetical protein
MARTVAEIQKQITDQIAADPVLSTSLTSTSKRAIYILWTFITAVSISIFEQIIDVFIVSIEATVAAAAPATSSWLQAQVFKFQYSATIAQVVQLINFAPVYPVVDASLRVVTRASVTSDLSNSVIIKVAKGNPPGALSSPEVDALQSYINLIGAEGITYIVRSSDADRLYVNATIFYSGLYSSVIQANVISAISAYLSNLPFNGSLKISDIELAIRNVVGVTDVILENIKARANLTPLAAATDLVLANATIGRLWPTQAGYIVEEDTPGSTFTDTLVFVPE